MSTVQPEELKDVFKSNLKRIRNELGLSQAALVERVNKIRKKRATKARRNDPTAKEASLIFVPYISSLENGDRSPTLDMIADLSEGLDVEPGVLIAEGKKIAIAS